MEIHIEETIIDGEKITVVRDSRGRIIGINNPNYTVKKGKIVKSVSITIETESDLQKLEKLDDDVVVRSIKVPEQFVFWVTLGQIIGQGVKVEGL